MSRYSAFKKADEILSQRRFDSSKNFDARFSKALENEEFKKNFVEYKRLSLQNISSHNKDTQLEIKKYSKNLLDIINKNGIDLNVYSTCSKCRDTGYINGEICDCKMDIIKSQLFNESHMPSFVISSFSDNKLDKIDAKQASKMQDIYKDCKRWADNIDDAKKRVIYLMGSVGVGKTTLALSIANEVLSSLHSVYYATAFDFSKLVIDKQFNRLVDEYNYYNMLDSDLLIIDDLGTEGQNSIAIENLFAIIDSRINNNKKTIICTNLSLEQFAKRYGERSLSRLTSKEYAYVPSYILGDDLRKFKC